MNTAQIKCFLAVAETLNFTKAAAQLYMTQPGLSRYIVSLERELNTLLFIRDQQKVRLTPAGAVLAHELEGFLDRMEEIINKVRKAGQGYSGTLTIGTLGGQWMGKEFTDHYLQFTADNPHIDLIFRQGSFREIRSWLTSNEIDIGLTLAFDIRDMPDILYEPADNDYPVMAVSGRSKLGQKERISLPDLVGETMISISPDDSRAGYELSSQFIRKSGINISKVRYAPNLATEMMWIESAQGIGIINHRSNLVANSTIRLIEEIKVDDGGIASNVYAWNRNNLNPAIPLFINSLR